MNSFPAEIDGERNSFVSEFRFDRSRPSQTERRLMLDFEVSRVPWRMAEDGKWKRSPGSDVSLVDEYFGENRHHINLAILQGKKTKFDIDSVTKARKL